MLHITCALIGKIWSRAKFGVKEDWEFGTGYIIYVVLLNIVLDTELTDIYMNLFWVSDLT